jgi:MFS-type transporter involved in bile tolerance (Atg22 family)
MNGRLITGVLTLLIPAILIAVTLKYFGSNPISILVLVIVMGMGILYLLSYPEVTSGHPTA